MNVLKSVQNGLAVFNYLCYKKLINKTINLMLFFKQSTSTSFERGLRKNFYQCFKS